MMISYADNVTEKWLFRSVIQWLKIMPVSKKGETMLEKIKIGGMEYQVKEVKFGESNGEVTLGECRFETAEILINENLSDDRKEQTIIHEMVHAMLFEAGSNEYDNEELVNQLGLIMYQVLKDNDFKSEKQQTKINLNLGSEDYQLIVDAFKRRDEDPVRQLD